MHKEHYIRNKYLLILIYLSFIAFVLYVIIISIKGYSQEKDELEIIYHDSFNGKIIRSEKSTRGFQYFDVLDNETGRIDSFFLHADYFFEENNIKINDSVSKMPESRVITFFKETNGKYVKCCDYELEEL
jgi:hypothetical protein